jgi:chromosome segregation ATPase
MDPLDAKLAQWRDWRLLYHELLERPAAEVPTAAAGEVGLAEQIEQVCQALHAELENEKAEHAADHFRLAALQDSIDGCAKRVQQLADANKAQAAQLRTLHADLEDTRIYSQARALRLDEVEAQLRTVGQALKNLAAKLHAPWLPTEVQQCAYELDALIQTLEPE